MAGKGAIVIPTGFITAKSGIEKRILKKIVDEHWVYGCVSMPRNVFATTGTNVSVLFLTSQPRQTKSYSSMPASWAKSIWRAAIKKSVCAISRWI